VLGPIVGGFVVEKHGFRWVFWVQFIFAWYIHSFLFCHFQKLISSVMLTLSALFVPETFAPTLLRRKAKRLQKEANELGTGEVFISKYDKVVKPRSEIIRVGMSRPFDMMFRELIVAALGLYGEFILRVGDDADGSRRIDLWYPICELNFSHVDHP
jgi:MFS family permease